MEQEHHLLDHRPPIFNPMRRTLLLTALIGTTGLSAQDFPFPTNNATWVQYFEVMITPPPIPQFAWMSTSNFCVDGTDTLITGTSYTQLRRCNADYVGGLREVDGAVYFHPADSTQEYLLYDFGAAVGDTLYDIYVNELLATGSEGWMGWRLVDVVVTASAPNPNYGGRIAVQVHAIDESIDLDSEWIEGMGCVFGLFTLNPLNISQYWYGLDCFSHNGTTYWNGGYNEGAGTCSPLFMSITEQQMDRSRAYPNPTSGTVRVEGLGPVPMVRDAVGRSVYAPITRVALEVVDIDLTTLPVGLYTVQDKNGRVVRLSRE